VYPSTDEQRGRRDVAHCRYRLNPAQPLNHRRAV